MSKPLNPNQITPDLPDLVRRIDRAVIYDLAKRTPCELAPQISTPTHRIWLKREDMQDVFSFKIRGAANRIARLTPEQLGKGVCAASAGNHAQGMAASARHYGTKAVIFMPVTTPRIKVDAVESFGAETRLVGDNYDAACDAAIAYAKDTGAVFVHPFDEIDVIAGQGTVGKEILTAVPNPAAVYVCTGGGGLVSGVGAYVKAKSANSQIIAVEAAGAPTLAKALEAGQPVSLKSVDGFADGTAVRRIGDLTFAISKQVVDRSELVSNDAISAAVRQVFQITRTLVEPSGAQALAGCLQDIAGGTAPEGDLVVTISGANVNFDRVGHIVERAELGAGGEMLFAASIAEKAGAFLSFINALGTRAVTEFNYRYRPTDTAHVLVGVKISHADERDSVLTDMQAAGIETFDLSNDSLSKRHLRHMVGGRGSADVAEVIYSFEFPERPGALADFLRALNNRWNISLFHYRNHGASSGQVLCGFQVPNDDIDALEDSLRATAYPMERETDNMAYKAFLQG